MPSRSNATISPGRTSRTSLAPTMSSAQVSDATTHASPTRPMTRGRQPRGSRAASNVPFKSTSRLKAPSARDRASASWSSGAIADVRASRCTSTSESIVEVKIEPRSSSSCLSSVALTRFPLWASAMCVPRKRASTGCAFSMVEVPAVLYRVWPMATGPGSSASSVPPKPSEMSPIRWTACATPSLPTATMPADSCPRCWREYSPRCTRRDDSG